MIQYPDSDVGIMLRWESDLLLRCIEEMVLAAPTGPIRLLEIGIMNGKTGALMIRQSLSGGGPCEYTAVDPAPQPDAEERLRTTAATVGLLLLTSRKALPLVRGPFDCILSDGCHCLQCAWFEWETYRHLVRPGGIYAMHDIAASVLTVGADDPHRAGEGGPEIVWKCAKSCPGWTVVGESLSGPAGLGVLRRSVAE